MCNRHVNESMEVQDWYEPNSTQACRKQKKHTGPRNADPIDIVRQNLGKTLRQNSSLLPKDVRLDRFNH